MRFLPIVLFLAVFESLVLSETRKGQKLTGVRKCHGAYWWRCVKPFLGATAGQNGTGFFLEAAQFDRYCKKNLPKSKNCFRKLVKRCTTPLWRELFNIAIDSVFDGFDEYCSSQKLRADYFGSQPCLNFGVKLTKRYRDDCVRPLQAALEAAHHWTAEPGPKKLEYFAHTTCCAFNRWRDCLKRVVVARCDHRAFQVVLDYIKHNLANAVDSFCPDWYYKPKSAKCRRLLPPLSAKALGPRSQSILSFFFSWTCRNVGYGIID